MSYQHYWKKIDVPADALLACRLYLEELHAVPAIQESFEVQLKKASRPPGGGGVLGISSDGDDRRIFWGLKFLIPRFFGVRKSGKYFFGYFDLSTDFWGVLKRIGSTLAT